MKKNFSCLALLPFFVLPLAACNQGHSHNYNFDSPTWSWSEAESGYTANVTFECSGCTSEIKDHFLTLDATVTDVKVQPTCETNGSITYTATASYSGKSFTDTKTDTIKKLGHDFTSISVTGTYETSYKALDSFDIDNLVVTATCAREGCHKAVTLTKDEYFVIYETPGLGYLCAGDTKVTISSMYAPFAKAEISGLTVTKIPNAIKGMESSYNTACHTVPNLEGVTSLSGDISIKYYSDQECKTEVSSNDLKAGKYYIKATAGDQNFEKVEKIAVLNVNHVFDQFVDDTKYLCSAATIYENAKYYKSCVCGESSSSPEDTFEIPYSKLPALVAKSSLLNYKADSMTAPEGYDTVTECTFKPSEITQGRPFLADIAIDRFDSVSFMFLTKNKYLTDRKWEISLNADTWYTAEIDRNDSGTFDVNIIDPDGNVKFTYLYQTSFRNCILYYEGKVNDDPLEFYSTEIKGLYRDIVPLPTTIIDSCALSANGVSTTLLEEAAPYGFETVRRWDGASSIYMPGKYYSNVVLSNYSQVTFAIKTSGYFIFNSWDYVVDPNQWCIITLTNNNNDTWNIDASYLTGNSICKLKNVSDYYGSNPGDFTNHALNSLLSGKHNPGYLPAAKTGTNTVVSVTELRGIAK